MTKYRNYWVYSIGCFAVWGVLLVLVASRGTSSKTHTVLLVFAGWTIGWVSGTVARFVYPPPRRWFNPETRGPDGPTRGMEPRRRRDRGQAPTTAERCRGQRLGP